MRTAMILQAFTGEHFNGWRNRQPNEILFAAQSDRGASFSAVIAGVMSGQVLATVRCSTRNRPAMPATRTFPAVSIWLRCLW